MAYTKVMASCICRKVTPTRVHLCRASIMVKEG